MRAHGSVVERIHALDAKQIPGAYHFFEEPAMIGNHAFPHLPVFLMGIVFYFGLKPLLRTAQDYFSCHT